MHKRSPISTLMHLGITAIQCGCTLALLMVIYFGFVLLDYEGGFDGFVGTVIFQPVLGLVVAGLTIALCLVVGAPLRLVAKANTWWVRHYYIAIVAMLIGIILLTLSLAPSFLETVIVEEDDGSITRQVPNTILGVTGWFVTAFFALHSYPPKFLTDVVERFILTLLRTFRMSVK